jgi:hypothetical protein
MVEEKKRTDGQLKHQRLREEGRDRRDDDDGQSFMATTGRAGWGIWQGPGSRLGPLPRCFELLKLCFRNGACSSFRGYALEGECARRRVSSCGRSTLSLSAYRHRSATLQHHIPITAEYAVATSHHSAAFWPAQDTH